MIVLIILFSVFIFFILKVSCRDSISGYFIFPFVAYWFFMLTISTFNPYDLYEVSWLAYFLEMIYILSFTIGFISKQINNERDIRIQDPAKIINSKIFKLIVCIGIVIVFSMYLFKTQIMVYNDIDSGYFRKDFFEIMFSERPLLLYAYYLFLFPLFFFLLSLMSYCLFSYRSWFDIFLYLAYIMLFMSLGEGRMAYMTLAVYLMFSFFYYKKTGGIGQRISKKVYYGASISMIALYILMANVTSNRMGYDNFRDGAKELNSTFISYSVLPMRTFDYAINNDYINKCGGYKFGRASICGFDFLISSIAKRIGIEIPSIREDTNGLLQNNAVPVGSQKQANYSFTAAIYHYFDLGYLGIFIMPFIFGRFCKFALSMLYKKRNIYMYALNGFLFFILLHTPFSWYFNKLFTIPYILFLLYKAKNKPLIRYFSF